MNGILVIDKPAGITSRDVVNIVQKWFPRKTKIGHTGTLDPLATGVLVVCIGAATRLADFVQAMGKSYQSRIRHGATSTTDDADGTVTANPTAIPPTREAIEMSLKEFIGTFEQFPPTVSALMVGGHRAHDQARVGKDVPLTARTVHIEAMRVLGYEWPWLDVEVDYGKGPYIRSIARDLGAKLGVGGLVEILRRSESVRSVGSKASASTRHRPRCWRRCFQWCWSSRTCQRSGSTWRVSAASERVSVPIPHGNAQAPGVGGVGGIRVR